MKRYIDSIHQQKSQSQFFDYPRNQATNIQWMSLKVESGQQVKACNSTTVNSNQRCPNQSTSQQSNSSKRAWSIVKIFGPPSWSKLNQNSPKQLSQTQSKEREDPCGQLHILEVKVNS